MWLPHIPVRNENDATQNFEALGSRIIVGVGNPQGKVGAPVGTIFLRKDGIKGSTVYGKESAVSSTDPNGWEALTSKPGPWELLSLGSSVEASIELQPPRVRVELESIRLRGVVKIKAGQKLALGATLFTLPPNCHPSGECQVVAFLSGVGGATQLIVKRNGIVQVLKEVTEGISIYLDGVTFNLT